MITKMTPEQEIQIAVYRDRWLKNGLRTDAIPFDTAVSECRWIYKTFLKEQSPEPVVFLVESPLQALFVANAVCEIIEKNKNDDSQLGSQLGSHLNSQLDSHLNSQLGSQLYSQLGSQLGSQLYSQLDSHLNSQLGSQLDSHLNSQLDSHLNSQLGSQLDSHLNSQLRSQLYSQLYSQLGSQLGSQLYSQLGSQLRSHLNSQLDQLYSQLGSQLYSQLNSQLGSQLGSQLYSQLYSQLGSQLRSHLNSQLDQLYSQLGSQLYSQLNSHLSWKQYTAQAWYWAGYYGFYDFVLEVLLPQEKPKFELFDRWRESLQRINWIVPLNGVCIVVQRPVELHLGAADSAGLRRLHRDGGMAVRFADGWGIHALNGCRVDAKIAETPAEALDAKLITTEKNAQVRAEIVKKIGIRRVLAELNTKVIDSSDGYELILLDLGDGRSREYLKMENPSVPGLLHIEGVKPGIKTVGEALTWRNQTEVRPQQLT